MAFGVATGGTTPPIYPVGSSGNGLSAAGFIPEIWSGKLVEKLYASTVLSAISNTEYEGEIQAHGDKVHIRTKPTITIRDYLADGLLTVDRPVGGLVDLLIDKGKYFNVIIDDVMKIQSDIENLSIWAEDAAEQFKIVIDTQVLAGILGGMSANNKGLTAGKITSAINLGVTGTPLALVPANPTGGQVDILDCILRLGQTLDEQNVPETGRWLVIPAWAALTLKRSELRQAYLTGDAVTPLRNGRVGQVDRFTVYISNLLPFGTPAGLAAGEYAFFAGHAHGLTFATQMTNMETIRSEQTFGTLLRGLQIYGYKIIDNIALAQAIVTKV